MLCYIFFSLMLVDIQVKTKGVSCRCTKENHESLSPQLPIHELLDLEEHSFYKEKTKQSHSETAGQVNTSTVFFSILLEIHRKARSNFWFLSQSINHAAPTGQNLENSRNLSKPGL